VQSRHHIFIVVKKSEQALIASQLDKIGRFRISLVPLDNSESENDSCSGSSQGQGQSPEQSLSGKPRNPDSGRTRNNSHCVVTESQPIGKYVDKETIDALYAVSQSRAYKDRNGMKRVRKSGTLILPGDLIASPDDLKSMFLKTRLEASPSSTAMWCLFGQTPWADAPLPGKSEKEKVMPDKLYTSDENSNLVNVQEMREYENGTLIDSNLTMNDKIGTSTTFFTQQSDLHTYMLQPWLFDFFVQTRKIKTYKDLPFEHTKKTENPEQFVSFEYSLSSLSDSIESIGIDINSDYGTLTRKLLLHCKREYEELSAGDIDIDLDIFENVYGRKEHEKVCVKMVRGVCNADFKSLRAKNLLSYVEGVRQMLKQKKKNLFEKECSGDYYQKTNSYISSEELTLTANKNQIQLSSISRGCTIATGSSLVSSIIYPNCVLRENSNLTNCIVYSGTTVPKNCTLKDCVIGPHNSLREGEINRVGENCVM